MEPEEYEIMYRVEDAHWWYQGMQEITRRLLARWYATGEGLQILDAGCGTGAAMTTYLADYGSVTGFDFSARALHFCRKRNAERLAQASVTEIPFASGSFDLATSFDVLYEQGVSSDLAGATELLRVLRRGGRLLLRLAAYDWLRGRHDVQVHTARRYTTGRVRELLSRAGFEIEQLSYANTFLFPVAVGKRLLEHIVPTQPGSDLEQRTGSLNRLLARTLSAEAPMVARGLLPYGLSVVAIARKP